MYRATLYHRRFNAVSLFTALLTVLAGLSILLGWVLNNDWLKGAYANGVTAKTNVGILFLLSGTSLFLQLGTAPRPPRLRAARLLAVVVSAVAALTLSQHFFGWNLHIDEFFFKEPPGSVATFSPNRMGISASFCFTLAGIALLLLRRTAAPAPGSTRIELSVPFAVTIAMVALLPTLGYLYGAQSIFGISRYTAIAFPTAFSLVVLAIGILFTPENGTVRSLLQAPTAGGVLARRLLLPGLLLPPFLAYFRTWGETLGYFDAPSGRALLVISFIFIFTALTWSAGRKLHAADLERLNTADAKAASEKALRRSEQNFHLLANSIPQLAWMARPDGHIFWYNQRWYDYTGTTLEQMEGTGWHAVHDPAVLPVFIDRWNDSLRSGQMLDMTIPLRGNDGAFRPYLTRVMPLKDDHGAVTLWFGTNTDISDQVRLMEERQLLLESERAARTQAERANRLKDEFLSTLSHELRTPLNAILGWSQILERGARDPDDLHEGLTAIYRNARAQARLVDDLLDMSRMTNGKLRIDMHPVNLGDAVHAAVESVTPALTAKDIAIDTDNLRAQALVSGDASRLEQIVLNLLTNAIKFTPRGGRIAVSLATDAGLVRVAIKDSGDGIAPEFIPHIFERFRQADATTARRHGGLGLGLALVKQLADLHGGSVTAESPGPGQGSTFTLTLPLSLAPAADYRPPADTFTGPISLAGLEILAVDDEPDALVIVKRILEEFKAEVLTASSAADALRLLKDRRPHVLVSDVGMPGMDGYEFIRHLRALPADQGGRTPAAALTAFTRSQDRDQALRAGFDAHIGKPVEAAELVAVVAHLAQSAAHAPPRAAETRPLHILLVEDHADTARAMTRALRALRHRVELAGSCASALTLVQNAPFDLLLCDLGLPDGSGLDLLPKLLAIRRLPAIALTGYTSDDDIAQCRAAGFRAHLGKPLNFSQLEATLQAAIISTPSPPAPAHQPR